MDITIVIISYNSFDLVVNYIKNLSKKIPIIVIENSRDKNLKGYLEKKYKNTKVLIPEKNLGYGAGLNLGIRESKTNIKQFDSDWLIKLNPVSFNYRKKDEDGKYTDKHYTELFYGLIAEETELVNKEICTYNDDKLIGIEYSKLIIPMLKMIQELKTEIELLKSE